MAEIQKFSLSYDRAEDRLAWDTEDAQGATTRLWLTQRLCRGFVAAFIPLLPKGAADAAPQHEATVQSWEQAAAMAEFGRLPAVRPSPGGPSGLISALHITPTATGLQLKLDFGDGETRTIGLTPAAARQTLQVIHRLSLAAGWAQDIWPAWIVDAAASAPADTVN